MQGGLRLVRYHRVCCHFGVDDREGNGYPDLGEAFLKSAIQLEHF